MNSKHAENKKLLSCVLDSRVPHALDFVQALQKQKKTYTLDFVPRIGETTRHIRHANSRAPRFRAAAAEKQHHRRGNGSHGSSRLEAPQPSSLAQTWGLLGCRINHTLVVQAPAAVVRWPIPPSVPCAQRAGADASVREDEGADIPSKISNGSIRLWVYWSMGLYVCSSIGQWISINVCRWLRFVSGIAGVREDEGAGQSLWVYGSMGR